MSIIKIFKAVAILTFFSVLTRVLGFVFKMILSRTISTELLGIYTIALSIFSVFITAISSGMPLSISKQTAENSISNNENKNHQIVTSGLIVSVLIAIVLSITLVFSKGLFTSILNNYTIYYLLLSMIPAIISCAIYTPFRGYLWGKEKYLKVSIVDLFEQLIRVLSCVILFLFLNSSQKLMATGISLSIACFLSTILGIVFYFTSKAKLKYNKKSIFPLVKSSGTITFVRLAGSLMQPLLVIIVPLRLVAVGLKSEQALSKLGIAMGMAMPLLSIPSTIVSALATVLIPKISTMVKENDKQQLKKQINSAIIFTLVCTMITLPCFIALGTPLSQVMFKTTAAGEYLENASWLIVVMCLAQITTSILNSMGLEKKTFKYYIISSVFLLACVYFLPKYAGIYSLLYGLGVSSLVICILNIYQINKNIGSQKTYLKEVLLLTIICIPSIIIAKSTFGLLSLIFPSIISIVLSAIISVGAFFAVLTTTKIVDIEFITSSIKSARKQKTLSKTKLKKHKVSNTIN